MSNERLEILNTRFKYTSETTDAWTFFKDADPVWRGDCDDYASNALLLLSDGSLWRFWWNVLTLQAVFWCVLSPKRNRHIRLWFKGNWICNIRPELDPKPAQDMTRLIPLLAPVVGIKLALGKFVSRKPK